MSTTQQETQQPQTVEGPGRYHVYGTPDGGWVVARAVGICEQCRGCGCGDQAEPIAIPAMVVKMAMQQGKGLLGKLKAATRMGA